MAVLEPVQPLNNIEVAQDAPSGTVTLFVDSRTGDVYATGDIMDIHNLTSVAISAVSLVPCPMLRGVVLMAHVTD